MPSLSLTQLLEDLEAYTRLKGTEGAFSTEDFADVLNLSTSAARTRLKKLMKAGRVIVVDHVIISMTGRPTKTRGYLRVDP